MIIPPMKFAFFDNAISYIKQRVDKFILSVLYRKIGRIIAQREQERPVRNKRYV